LSVDFKETRRIIGGKGGIYSGNLLFTASKASHYNKKENIVGFGQFMGPM